MSIRLLVLSFARPRVDDIFRRGRDHSEPICTCSKLLTIRQFALPNSDAFTVIDYKLVYIYQCMKHALHRAGDIFRRGRAHPESICTCSKLLTIRRFALPNSDAFAVMIFL